MNVETKTSSSSFLQSTDNNNKSNSIFPSSTDNRSYSISSPSSISSSEESSSSSSSSPPGNLLSEKSRDDTPPPPSSPIDDGDDDTYWWKYTTKSSDALMEDIDIEAINKSTHCGYYKCYFPSKTSSHPQQQQRYGYLIGQDRDYYVSPACDIEYHQKAYDLAMELQHRYGIRHFMVSGPMHIDCSKSLADVLNTGYMVNKYQETRSTTAVKHDDDDDDDKRDRKKLIVEVVEQAPEPYLIIHIGITQNNLTKPTVERVGTNNFFRHVDNITMFRNNLLHDWISTRSAWLAHPELILDYQFILDYEGRIWQIDMERAFQSGTWMWMVQSKQMGNLPTTKRYYVLDQLNDIEKSIIYPFMTSSG